MSTEMEVDLFADERQGTANNVLSESDPSIPKPSAPSSCEGWRLEELLKQGRKFTEVPRVSALLSAEELKKHVDEHEETGMPLIIEGWHEHPQWPKDLFTVDWLSKNGIQDITVRNCLNSTDSKMTLVEFIDKCRASSLNVRSGDTERFYGKDLDCPKEWEHWLENGPLPPSLLQQGPNNLLQFLPESHHVETLMCYLGIGDTYTPAHKDLCASSGQNLMCYTENSGSSFWFMTKSSDAPAAARYLQNKLGYELDHESYLVTLEEFANAPFTIYIAEQKLGDLVLVPKRSCHQVVNAGGLTIKSSWSRMTIDGLITAFYHELPIYRRVCRPETYRVRALCYYSLLQFTGEAENLQKSINKASDLNSNPHVEEVGQTDNASVLHSLEKKDTIPSSTAFSSPLSSPPPLPTEDSTSEGDVSNVQSMDIAAMNLRLDVLANDLRKLLSLFDKILKEEYDDGMVTSILPGVLPDFSSGALEAAPPSSISNISCDFCGADIFESYFECKRCISTGSPGVDIVEADDSTVICPGCYVEGRTCKCTRMRPWLSKPFQELIDDRNRTFKFLETRFQKIWRPICMSEALLKNYRTIDHPPVFQGACILWQKRKFHAARVDAGKSDTRRCTRRLYRNEPSHTVPVLSALYCPSCHSTSCFNHLLKLGIHSCEAIFMHERDNEGGKAWHEYHMKQRYTFKQRFEDAEVAERAGTVLNTLATSGWAASKYRHPQPRNPRTQRGWYDYTPTIGSSHNGESVGEIGLNSQGSPKRQNEGGSSTSPPASRHSASPMTIRIPAQNLQIQTVPTGRSVYIEIPPAPYDTSMELFASECEEKKQGVLEVATPKMSSDVTNLGKRLRFEIPVEAFSSKRKKSPFGPAKVTGSRSSSDFESLLPSQGGDLELYDFRDNNKVCPRKKSGDLKIETTRAIKQAIQPKSAESAACEVASSRRSTASAVLVPYREIRSHSDAWTQTSPTDSSLDIISTSLTEKQFRDFLRDSILDVHPNTPQQALDMYHHVSKIDKFIRMNQILEETVTNLTREMKELKETVSELRTMKQAGVSETVNLERDKLSSSVHAFQESRDLDHRDFHPHKYLKEGSSCTTDQTFSQHSSSQGHNPWKRNSREIDNNTHSGYSNLRGYHYGRQGKYRNVNRPFKDQYEQSTVAEKIVTIHPSWGNM